MALSAVSACSTFRLTSSASRFSIRPATEATIDSERISDSGRASFEETTVPGFYAVSIARAKADGLEAAVAEDFVLNIANDAIESHPPRPQEPPDWSRRHGGGLGGLQPQAPGRALARPRRPAARLSFYSSRYSRCVSSSARARCPALPRTSSPGRVRAALARK